MNEEIVAKQILKALRLEIREYQFPIALKIGILMNRYLPRFINDKIITRYLPEDY